MSLEAGQQNEKISLWFGGADVIPHDYAQKMAVFLLELPEFVEINPPQLYTRREHAAARLTLQAMHGIMSQKTSVKDSSNTYNVAPRHLERPAVSRAMGAINKALFDQHQAVDNKLASRRKLSSVNKLLGVVAGRSSALFPDANCRDTHPSIFFSSDTDNQVRAKGICEDCPAKIPCLKYALDNKINYGIWGGRDEKERRKILRYQPASP